MIRKKYILILLLILTPLLLYLWRSSFVFYETIKILPDTIIVEYQKNKDSEYFLRTMDSLGISYHSVMGGRYYQKGEKKTKTYWNVPNVLYIGSKYFIIGSNNNTFDDGIAYCLPFKYQNIDIYENIDFRRIYKFTIDKYVEFAYFDSKNLYLIFNDGQFSKINIP